jgi:hypothetical protein
MISDHSGFSLCFYGRTFLKNQAGAKSFVPHFIGNDITNFSFRLSPKPYAEAFERPKAKFLMSLS